MDSKWFLENDIASKLRAAVENIAVGQGWAVFEGLESGEVTVKLVHDGQGIHFVKEIPHPTEAKTPQQIPDALKNLVAHAKSLDDGVPLEVPTEAKEPIPTSAGDLFCEKHGVSYGSMLGGPDQKCPACEAENAPSEKTHKSRRREQP